MFQRAGIERQCFEIAHKALRKLKDTSTIDTSGTEISCQSVYHLPHSDIPEHHSCSEPMHLLEDLESIGTVLHHMVEAGKNEPTMMLNSKDQFDASSARTCKLERDLVQVKAFRAMTNIQYPCDRLQDKLLNTRIDELEQSWKEEKCFRGEVVACLLQHTKTDIEGCEKTSEAIRNHRSRNGAFLDLRKFGRCCGPDASLVSVTST
jgi:hypothetical protein